MPAGRPAKKPVKGKECLIRLSGFGKCLDQERGQFRQHFAGRGRAYSCVAPVVPTLDGGNDLGGLFETHFGNRFQGFRIIIITGKNKVTATSGQFRRCFKQRCVMEFHLAHHFNKSFRKRIGRLFTHHGRRCVQTLLRPLAGYGFAHRLPSECGVQRNADTSRLLPATRLPRMKSSHHRARRSVPSIVPVLRNWGRLPPAINCWVWTKNSISRMPPRPSFTL